MILDMHLYTVQLYARRGVSRNVFIHQAFDFVQVFYASTASHVSRNY